MLNSMWFKGILDSWYYSGEVIKSGIDQYNNIIQNFTQCILWTILGLYMMYHKYRKIPFFFDSSLRLRILAWKTDMHNPVCKNGPKLHCASV